MSDNKPIEWKGFFQEIYYASFNEREPHLVAICGSSSTEGFAINVIYVTHTKVGLLHTMLSAHEVIYTIHMLFIQTKKLVIFWVLLKGKINEVKWQKGGRDQYLATCSVDHSVKVYHILFLIQPLVWHNFYFIRSCFSALKDLDRWKISTSP